MSRVLVRPTDGTKTVKYPGTSLKINHLSQVAIMTMLMYIRFYCLDSFKRSYNLNWAVLHAWTNPFRTSPTGKVCIDCFRVTWSQVPLTGLQRTAAPPLWSRTCPPASPPGLRCRWSLDRTRTSCCSHDQSASLWCQTSPVGCHVYFLPFIQHLPEHRPKCSRSPAF